MYFKKCVFKGSVNEEDSPLQPHPAYYIQFLCCSYFLMHTRNIVGIFCFVLFFLFLFVAKQLV